MRTLRRSVALLICLAVAGCGSPNLYVVDETGRPVEGATITAAWPSYGGPVATTNGDGAARIDVSQGSSIQPEMQSFSIEKQGYQPAGLVDAQQPQPFRIVLRRSVP